MSKERNDNQSISKSDDSKENYETKVVKVKPAAKSIENNVSERAKAKGEKEEGVQLAKRIQTAEGWKREQMKLRDK